MIEHVQEEVSFVISATWRHGGLRPGLTSVAISNPQHTDCRLSSRPSEVLGSGKAPHCGEIEGQ